MRRSGIAANGEIVAISDCFNLAESARFRNESRGTSLWGEDGHRDDGHGDVGRTNGGHRDALPAG